LAHDRAEVAYGLLMRRLIVLLRGVNVSGRNTVPMAELRSELEGAGGTSVTSYIQSGNIALDSELDPRDMVSLVEDLLAEYFELSVPVVVVEQSTIAAILDASPFDDDGDPTRQLVYFPGAAVDVAGVDAMDPERWPGDEISASVDAVYVSYENGQGKSKLSVDQLERAAGCTLTGRNVRTVHALIDL
jgi:uncharacterized protein (DUF1697 family)